jgi:hypothetical protein
MLDFMNPVPPLRRLLDQRSKLGLNEPEVGACGNMRPVLTEEARTVDARASSALRRDDDGQGTITTA